MILKKWEDLPCEMQTPEVKKYYEALKKRRLGLALKRIFDIAVSLVLLVFLAIPLLVISALIALDSPGGVFYRQVRVTRYGEEFRIHKFRTMVKDADKIGSLVTVDGDSRVTRVGGFLRKYRLDELPQVFDVISGKMSFVGTRPEVTKYVERYTPEMRATLLLPAGITSEASIRYKDEAELLDSADDVDKVYVETVLPGKMKYNLKSVEEFSFLGELKTMVRTVLAVLGKDYSDNVETKKKEHKESTV